MQIMYAMIRGWLLIDLWLIMITLILNLEVLLKKAQYPPDSEWSGYNAGNPLI